MHDLSEAISLDLSRKLGPNPWKAGRSQKRYLVHCTITGMGHGGNMDPAQIIVYAILWTFCFAVTVYALVISR
ncbi:MAG: hypothetical protein WBD42_06850 [Methylovirgula sp.]